ncbi:Gpi16 subunit, GPI transamidase component [Metschnikowia bicuspidata var. bicuspidata NRRL YB-4993]|uniref:Gpi16 subunit, GPI transamidase component n=1 Tax=Metschnikowia bicuspidata var. bicuspidata NRRL YB-4993 TaxID=869754 RepID=A0A1A0H5X9_9ASCO|nr:Gpi16 subunit, GPI transamidase component [Metschnikowia bicuspidata var. bicuspidata NRRL YB-4993]OBA19312.1 Gpi16 subunit, GPI transamidase component [Metschnikowia bicuspidata var. bicuspidata NRRL YB-4993]
MLFLALLALASLVVASSEYSESLTIKPLPRNKILTSFEFDSQLPSFPLVYVPPSLEDSNIDTAARHYGMFPKSVEPVLRATNTRQLHLRFTQGWWHSESWGQLPRNGSLSGGTGVELWAVVEATDLQEANQNWRKLADSLSGFFCALLNFVDESITTYPRHDVQDMMSGYAANSSNSLFLLRAALPDEPVCTENLTPFLKMLATRGKAGVSSLLDGHKLYDSLWHSMSIDIVTECEAGSCHLRLKQSIHHVIDVVRLLRRIDEGGIPKPTPGDKLRCDTDTKKYDSWTCFPLGDSIEMDFDLNGLYGRLIRGAGFNDPSANSKIVLDFDQDQWHVQVEESQEDDQALVYDAKPVESLKGKNSFNLKFRTNNSNAITASDVPPLLVSRSLTGYSQDKGGMRINLKNPSISDSVEAVYFETLPWFMRIYLHTLTVHGKGEILSQFYIPAIDRKRPGHLELLVRIPPGEDVTFTYQFDKSLLLYAEYPPDANHGFAIAPAVVKVLDALGKVRYESRSTSLLLTLPTPDFSMPYNVIILTCTVMALAFGTTFNLLTKKVVTEEEFEEAAKHTKFAKFKSKLQALRN